MIGILLDTTMQFSLTELLSGGGAVGIGSLLVKFWPKISKFLIQLTKIKSEERKLEMEMSSGNKSEVIDIWKDRYDEEKTENNELKSELKEANEKILVLEIKFTKIREKWLNSEQLRSYGKGKPKNPNQS